MKGSEKDFIAAVDKNAYELSALYLKVKAVAQLNKTLEECMQNQVKKIEELKDMYLADLQHVKFLTAAYFDDYTCFKRYQDIPEHYFVKGCRFYFFLSHQWETELHPDPEGRQFEKFKQYLCKFPKEENQALAYWYDYSCSPQRDAAGNRTAEEELVFLGLLKVMHLITAFSITVVLISEAYMGRSWCCAEWAMASYISPIFIDSDTLFPFGNMVKFSQMALLVTYLKMGKEEAKAFMAGDDYTAMALINTMLRTMAASKSATYAGDKHYLQLVLHRHFWYHVRFFGFRSELLIALRRFETYDNETIRALFGQFLIFTNDPHLEWFQAMTFSLETMLVKGRDTFDDIVFHGNEIVIQSNSK